MTKGKWFKAQGFLFVCISGYHGYSVSRWLAFLTKSTFISLVIFYGFHTSVCVFLSTRLGLIKYRNVRGHLTILRV